VILYKQRTDQNITFAQHLTELKPFMKKIFTLFVLIISFTTASAQIVNIPDANFKEYLLDNQNINTNRDNEIQVSEAENFTGLLNCSNSGINNITGIEAFINLTELYCYNNPLNTLDISKNTKLKTLWCESNQLSSLDLSKNLLLEGLDCSNNQLTSLNISKNTLLKLLQCDENAITDLDLKEHVFLTDFDCSYNQLSNLDTSHNLNLTQLDCSKNQLTTLNVSNNLQLRSLGCAENQLTSIDITKNSMLEYFFGNENQFTAIDFSKNILLYNLHCEKNYLTNLNLSENPLLEYLFFSNNKIQDVDLSKNTKLKYIDCNDNVLEKLDTSKNLKLQVLLCNHNNYKNLDFSKNLDLARLQCNNNNSLTTLNLKTNQQSPIILFSSTNNPNLFCIQVDNVSFSSNYWTEKDNWTTYNTDCNYMSVNDVQKSQIQIYPNPVKDKFIINTNDKIEQVEIYSLTGQILKTGHSKEINISYLPKGNYIVNVKTDKNGYSQKLIKE